MRWEFNSRMIYSDKIDEFMKSLFIDKTFLGCFPKDALPYNEIKKRQNDNSDWSIIVNLDNLGEPGSHYVAYVFSINTLFIYDSVPISLHYMLLQPSIDNICTIYKNSIRQWRNSTQVQSVNSNACGYFCMWFILKFFIVKPKKLEDLDQVLQSITPTKSKQNEHIIIQELQDFIEVYVNLKHKHLQGCLLKPLKTCDEINTKQ